MWYRSRRPTHTWATPRPFCSVSCAAPDRNGWQQINGSVAYAAQRAWIQNATLRDNVLFGTPYDADRYARVLAACALTSDLDLLEAGDQTEIGEKGSVFFFLRRWYTNRLGVYFARTCA